MNNDKKIMMQSLLKEMNDGISQGEKSLKSNNLGVKMDGLLQLQLIEIKILIQLFQDVLAE